MMTYGCRNLSWRRLRKWKMREFAPVGGQTTAYGIITSPQHKGIPLGIKQGLPYCIDLGCLDGRILSSE